MESRIPVILIQRPGACSSVSSQTNISHGSGWDLIIPPGFAMAFWVALVYRGARVGGLREARSTCLQAGLLSSPDDYPDTQAGQAELLGESEVRKSKHSRMPPAKRPNFVKLGFNSPFHFEFEKLVKEWCNKSNPANDSICDIKQVKDKVMSVLRNKKMLRLLHSAVKNPKGFCKSMSKGQPCNKGQEQTFHSKILSTEVGKKLVSNEMLSLVPVRLCVLQRGVPAKYGHICSPSVEDLKTMDGDKTFGGPFEPKHKDPGQAARKEERKERLRLRRRKKRGKGKKESAVSSDQTDVAKMAVGEKPSEEERDNKHSEESEKSISLLGSTSRDIIGLIKGGDFDLVTGQGLGFGFCSVAALLTLIEHQKDRKFCLVLVRNPTSLQYRFASVSLLV